MLILEFLKKLLEIIFVWIDFAKIKTASLAVHKKGALNKLDKLKGKLLW